MNSILTERWLRHLVLLAFMTMAGMRMQAQCTLDPLAPYAPVPTFNLAVDAIFPGQADLNGFVVSSFFNADCPFTNVNFYSGPSGGVSLGSSITYSCSDVGSTFTLWVSVRDAGNNPASESPRRQLVVTIIDNTNPTVTCPASQNVNTDPGQCFATVPGLGAVAADNCSISRVTWAKTGATTASSPATGINDASNTTFNVGTTTVTYTAADPSNRTTSCAFTVTVTDAENPTITCPVVSPSYNADNGVCYATVNGLTPTVGDNCTISAVSWIAIGANPTVGANDASGTQFPLGVTSLTYVVSDASAPANTATCMVNINVLDNQPPMLSNVPANVTVSTATGLTLCDGQYGWNHPTISDNCVGPYTLTMQLSGATNVGAAVVTPGAAINQLFNLGTTTITYVATDANAQMTTQTFQVQVIDDIDPVITPTFQLNYSVAVTPGDCSAAVTFERPNQAIVIFVPPFVFSNYIQTDCGIITGPVEGPAIVNGVTDPNFLNSIQPINIFDPANRFATITFPVGTTIIPYTWTDNVGNSTTVNVTIVVTEANPPTAKCVPGIVTLPLTGNMATLMPNMINNGSTDNCGINTITVSPSSFDCSHVAANQTVTLTVTDFSNNTATCTATVDIVDNTAPEVQCPVSLSVPANNGCDATGLTSANLSAGTFGSLVAGQYADNCSVSSVTWSLSGPGGNPSTPASSPPAGINTDLSGVTFRKGTTIVTYTIRDGSTPANQRSCSFSVNVSDLTGPVFSNVPQNVTLTANLAGCLASYSWNNPTVADACSEPSMILSQTHFPGAFFPFGTTTVTYLAKDAVGNISTTSFNITVVDGQAPVANCKDISVALDAGGNVTVQPMQVDNNSTDNCFFNYTSSDVSYDCDDLGDNIYTLTLEDGSGNTASCAATITVIDNIPPVAICDNITDIDLDADGSFVLTAVDFNNGSTDNCPASLEYAISVDGSLYDSEYAFGCDDLGVNVLTLLVTDGGNNESTCTRSVSVNDVTPPSYTVPNDITIQCDESVLPANTGELTDISDACDDEPTVDFVDILTPLGCANERIITRIWSVTDASSNSMTAIQLITVEDTQAPVFAIQDTFMIETDSPDFCDAFLPFALTSDNISDNCAGYANLTITYTIDYPVPSYGYVDVVVPVNGTAIPDEYWPIGTTKIVWRATDACGNTASTNVFIVVEDTQGPVFDDVAVCGQTFVLNNTPGACSNIFSWLRPSVLFPSVLDCTGFTVQEEIDDITVQQSINISNPYDYLNTQPFEVFVSAQFPVGLTTVTYTATDVNQNTSVCSFTVEVVDNQTPILTCPQNQIFQATCPDAQIPDYRNLVLVSDNCPGDVELTQNFAPGLSLGTIFSPNLPMAGDMFTVVVTGEDQYNSSTCQFTVTLEDGDAPIPTLAVLPDLIDSCGAFIIEAPSATDPCNPGAPLIYGTPSTPVGTFIPGIPPKYNLLPGNYVITWVYDDGNGNISTQPQNITVLNDVFPPVALCKPGFNINLGIFGTANISVGQINNGSFDPNDCGSVNVGISQSLLDCDNIGVNVITLTATDHKGNTATCSTTVTVNDVHPPVFVGAPVNVTLESCDDIPDAVLPTVVDTCDNEPDIIFTETSTQTANGPGFYNYTITRFWVATDASGNSASHSQVITVEDSEAPTFSALAPDTIMVTTNAFDLICGDTVNLNLTQFISDCAGPADLTVTNSAFPLGGAIASGIYSVGTHNVVFTATDVSGNVSTYNVVVIVKDGTSPTAVCINGVSAALQPSGFVNVFWYQFNNNSSDNCTAPDALDILVQRMDLNPLLPPSELLTYNCQDADGVTQHPVKMFVTDEYGNMSMCQTYIIIQDNVFPTITSCPPSRTVQCTDNLAPSAQGTATASDNCTIASLTHSDTIVAGMGNICQVLQRTWRVVDQANNLTTCLQSLSIQDTIRPSFTQLPPDDTISCSDVLGAPLVLSATDNCTMDVMVTFSQDTINIGQDSCGKYSYTVRRTWTAIDDCGNTAVHTRNITVTDTDEPLFLGLPDTLTVLSANFPPMMDCTVPVSFDISQFLFDCAPVDELLVTNDAPHGDTSLSISGNYDVGIYVIHFSAIDPCGNVGVDSLVLRVVDNSVPTAICNGDVVISLGTNGMAMLTPDDIDLGSTDNCFIDTMFLSQSIFDCTEVGINEIVLTVVDSSGNSNTCSVDVEVEFGPNTGFDLATMGSSTSSFGSADGTAEAMPSGGSGSFSFEWSNGDTTASISGLVAGFYIVSVTDSGTGCMLVDTVEVLDGPKLQFTIGNESGAQGATVSVPVFVENFSSMLGFSFNTSVDIATVGEVTGVSGIDPALASGFLSNVAAGTLSVLWSEPSLTPVDLPNGTIVFYIDVLLGTDPIGSFSPVTVDTAAVGFEFLQDINGMTVEIMAAILNGSVLINAAQDDKTIAGDIKTWINPENPNSTEKPVENVTVTLSGSVSDVVITDASGMYDFIVPSGSSTITSCSKSTPGNAGITAGDLLRIVNHIFGDTLPSPYQWVAADVNNSNTVTLADYLLIQRVVLGTDPNIMNSPDWKFIPKSYVFPPIDTTAFGPLTLTFPQTIEHPLVDMDFLDDDFVAVRMGDVNGNTPVNFNDDANDRYNGQGALYFRLDDRSFAAGDRVAVPVKARDFKAKQAYQFTISFNPDVMMLEDLEMGALPGMTEENFGTAHLADGFLTNAWVSHDPVTLEDDVVLFTLYFRARQDAAALSGVLQAGSQVTRAESYTTDGEVIPVDFRYEKPLGNQEPFVLYQNVPNPFRNTTSIAFRLPESGRTVLRVFNSSGQLVKMHIGNFDRGYNEVVLRRSDLGGPGVYWYELETATHSDRKKMIFID